MGKYFLIQIKRLLRHLPGALLVALLLLAGIWTAFQMLLQQDANSEDNKKIKIAFCGEIDDMFLQMGISALENLDNTRFSMELLQLEQAEAESALSRGEVSAYIVIPTGFMDAAMAGEIIPMEFVTTTGAAGPVSIFKEELCKVISSLLVNSQKGVFGLWDAMHENELDHKLAGQMDALSLIYVDYILARNHVYRVDELGISDALSLEQYLLCGLSVALFLLVCLPFAPPMIRDDPAMSKMLQSRGLSAFRQSVCEFLALTGMLAIILLGLLALASGLGIEMADSISRWSLLLRLIPVLLTISAFSYLIYSITEQLISGVLMHFFLTLALCFVSGCLYPVFFFPSSVQLIAGWLPTGLARTQVASCITGAAPTATLALLGYSLVFFAAGTLLRVRKVREVAL